MRQFGLELGCRGAEREGERRNLKGKKETQKRRRDENEERRR